MKINRKDYQVSDLNDNLSLSKLVGFKIVDVDCWVTLDSNNEEELYIVPNRIIFENGDSLSIEAIDNENVDIGLRNATDHNIPGVIFNQKALRELREQDPDYDPEEWDE